MRSDEVLRAAARVQQLGDEVRRLADQVRGSGAVQWRSTAATGFRHRLAEQAARVKSSAALLDDAADALRRHAAAVDQRRGWFGLWGHR